MRLFIGIIIGFIGGSVIGIALSSVIGMAGMLLFQTVLSIKYLSVYVGVVGAVIVPISDFKRYG
ncbi:DUF5957 family protein [Gracilibacillus caseinilyticus]|uniref:DUF5957 family protein n=1 Tax=Gracilibacillus caseinilyticus TaxID=2932256 RepID=A0ABY4EVX3_9BACI|nr:DUF5957 family protein [Gracilibacillus caseinilyticus]UOQ48561.1 DUF5957 family protein [Gracilibacillus caseinilyticus]